MSEKSLQEKYAPNNACFGCGPANTKGLRVQSFEKGDEVIADWKPAPHHEAFPGVINGGIIGSILDCHCNWTAAYLLMKAANQEQPPCTVTAEYTIKLLRPTPNTTLHLVAKATEMKGDRAIIEAVLTADGKACATCKGLFVAVKPGHPAYHRW